MKAITYLNESSQLAELEKFQVQEVIVSCKEISPASELNRGQLGQLLHAVSSYPTLAVFLEWDDLLTESKLQQQWLLVQELLSQFPWAGMRVKDLGAANLLKNNFPQLKLHLILEAGHRNLPALKIHCQQLRPVLSRLVLSPEVPGEVIGRWRQELKVELELQVFGKILLFTTPRPLLQLQVPSEVQALASSWQASGHSEESPHRGFYFFQGPLGMQMYLPKELSLLPYLAQLQQLGLDVIRVDLRFEQRWAFAPQVFSLLWQSDSERYSRFKASYPAPLIPGFFLANQTDRQFKNLKNTLLSRTGEHFFGEIKEVKRDSHLVIELGPSARQLVVGQELHFLSAEGKQGQWQVNSWRDVFGQEITSAEGADLIVVPYRAGASVRGQVFLPT